MTLKYTLIIEGTKEEISIEKGKHHYVERYPNCVRIPLNLEFKAGEEQKKRRYKTLEELVAMGHVSIYTTTGIEQYQITPYGQSRYFTLTKGLVGTITTDTNPSLTVEV